MERIVIEIDVAAPLVFYKITFRNLAYTWDNKTKKSTRTLIAILEDILMELCLRYRADGVIDQQRSTSLFARTLNYYRGRGYRGLLHKRTRGTHFKEKG